MTVKQTTKTLFSEPDDENNDASNVANATTGASGVAAQRTLTLGHEKCQSKKISNKVAYSVIKYRLLLLEV